MTFLGQVLLLDFDVDFFVVHLSGLYLISGMLVLLVVVLLQLLHMFCFCPFPPLI